MNTEIKILLISFFDYVVSKRKHSLEIQNVFSQ